jgi:tetratricopeptide (TPR) repeat protein/predicted aspartyl protease
MQQPPESSAAYSRFGRGRIQAVRHGLVNCKGRSLLAAIALVGSLLLAGRAPAACKLGKMAEFPITMTGMRPLTTAQINGRDVEFTVDSGAFFSILSSASASELDLKTHFAPFGFFLTGVNGNASVSVATVKVFTLAGVPLHDVDFLVGGSDISGSAGLLGQNVLHIGDVEYDLGQGVVRLMRPDGCGKEVLAYWVKANEPYSEMDIEPTSRERSQTIGRAFLNGAEIRVEFDTGAGVSMLSLEAAARAGIKPDSPGVVPAGESGGIGRGTFATYIAPFSSFKIGDEEIKNTRLRIGGMQLANADMLIGPDFFLSHRVYVANSQHKVYFTYNGGPVFNLAGAKHTTSPAQSGSGASPAAEGGASSTNPDLSANGSPTPGSSATESASSATSSGADAADLSRRGQALAARRDFEQALADFDRACELAPDNADYVYQRGIVHLELRQDALALADFDRAIKLKPGDADALMARARLKFKAGDKPGAGADLDAADAALPKETNMRLRLAASYEQLDLLEPATRQFDLWIASHGEDLRLPEALNGRCWAKALRGVDLQGALKDCDAALRHAKKASAFFAQASDSRGLVYLRLGNYDRSIADYNASLKINPKDAWSLYGRGVDETHLSKTTEGQADMDEAVRIWPKVVEEFKPHGIAP